MTFRTIEDLYNAYSWRTASKFVPLATKHGFSASEAREFLKRNVEHDIIPKKPEFMHIYSKTGGEYQMDTFINDKSQNGINYLIFININTRKAYAYELRGKGSNTVLNALTKFLNDVNDIKSIVSDQDKAYLSEEVLQFMKDNNISYRTTEDNNHNVLGIINRFMRTIRDYYEDTKYIEPDNMMKFIKLYNESPHRGINHKSPNEMTPDDEDKYIKIMAKVNPYKFQAGEKVKTVIAKSPLSKNRRNVSKEAYVVDSKAGNQFLVRAKDDSVDKYPGYRIVKTNSNKMAKSLKAGKRGIVESIESYNPKSDKYKIVYEGGVNDLIKARNLREGTPTQLSSMERTYWSQQKHIPDSIKKWI